MSFLRVAIIVAWYSAVLWMGMMVVALLVHVGRQLVRDLLAARPGRHLRRGRHEPSSHKAFPGPPRFKKLIIQITTIGDDIIVDTVRHLWTSLGDRDRSLYEIWVVTECTDPRSYPFVDRVLVVPPDFQTTKGAKFKGRAHEYARRCRVEAGLTDYKVLYIDDDTSVSPEFIDECYDRTFDLMQGPVNIGHPRGFLPSIDAASRAVSCLSLCSFFQEISHHLFTHGEGFCIDERVDRAVSWDHPGWYADDLVYGALATRRFGFRMSSTYAAVQTNSPIGLRQFVTQRRRWFWALVRSNYLLPRSLQVELWGLTVIGMGITPLAVTGMLLAVLGIFELPDELATTSEALFVLWVVGWGCAGYFAQRGVRGVLVGAVSSMIAPAIGFLISIVGILMGPTQTFEVMKRVERRDYEQPIPTVRLPRPTA